ncbi:MAG TPA: SDR family oxidoreductase [Candidimonas sp.]|nr:SDR family oxidoreductase [Candidimonas sp.]
MLNAGFAAISVLNETDAGFFDHMMNADVRGPILQMATLAEMLNPGASVVLTSSTSAYEGAPMASVYAVTKGAMISMARCWAPALGERDIRVNVLAPSPIDTDFRNLMSDDFRNQFEADVIGRLPLRRDESADEAAAVALFLSLKGLEVASCSCYEADKAIYALTMA